jgi:hypothetical protein
MRRKTRALLAAGIAAAVLLALLWAGYPRPTEADRITAGMTLPEVKAVLGRPPGVPERDIPGTSSEVRNSRAIWLVPDDQIDVYLVNGRVESVTVHSRAMPFRKKVARAFGL